MSFRGDGGLLLTQDCVHDPAPPYMFPMLAAMVEDVGVVAARFFQGVSKDGEPDVVQWAGGEKPVIVSGLCQVQHGGRQPSGGERNGAEGVAEDLTQQLG